MGRVLRMAGTLGAVVVLSAVVVLGDAQGAELHLTPAGAKRFAAGIARLAASGGYAVLVRDGRVFLAARVVSALVGKCHDIDGVEDSCRDRLSE